MFFTQLATALTDAKEQSGASGPGLGVTENPASRVFQDGDENGRGAPGTGTRGGWSPGGLVDRDRFPLSSADVAHSPMHEERGKVQDLRQGTNAGGGSGPRCGADLGGQDGGLGDRDHSGEGDACGGRRSDPSRSDDTSALAPSPPPPFSIAVMVVTAVNASLQIAIQAVLFSSWQLTVRSACWWLVAMFLALSLVFALVVWSGELRKRVSELRGLLPLPHMDG